MIRSIGAVFSLVKTKIVGFKHKRALMVDKIVEI